METIVISGISPEKERYFFERKGNCPIKSGMILIFREDIDGLKDSEAKKKISMQKPIKAEFKIVNPNKNEEPVDYFYDIHPFLNDLVQNNLKPEELKFYSEKIYPIFKDFEIYNYHVQDKDGYVNIRKNPDVSSEIVGTAKTGDYVCFVSTDEHKPDWVFIYYGKLEGYVHKSRLVRE